MFSPVQVSAQSPLVAFPGAEGFGAQTIGGRGGKVFVVSNLNDTGAGSLRECVSASGPRTCVFSVGGTITLNSVLSITNPYITIAGQTAPGGGITIKSNGSDIFSPRTHDIIIRYITGRPGPGGENHAAQIADNKSTELYNIIFDHCSFSWGIDSVWETWYRVYDSTIQWSFANEGLDCSTHSKGCHSKGIMIGGYKLGEGDNSKGSYNISVHHNLMAHDGERTPLMQFCGNGQVINNITYNPYWTFAHQEINCADPAAVSTVNWIGNYHKKGPDSTSNTDLKIRVTGGSSTGRAFVQGNIGPARANNSLPDQNWVDSESRSFLVTTPVSAPAVTTTDAFVAYDQVLNEGGNSKRLTCEGTWVNRRDSIDTRVVNEVKTGTGRIIDNPSEVGGWVTIDGGTACADTDKDGMPDAFETINGLNVTANDTHLDKDGDGYKNLEEYLNGTGTSGTTQNTSTPTPTGVSTVTPTPIITTITRPMKYYGVDRGSPFTDANFANLTSHAAKTIILDTFINDANNSSNAKWANIKAMAAKYNFNYVVWPNQGGDVSGCGWETPFNSINASGSYIYRVTTMLDALSLDPHFIGIISAHEPMWNTSTCKTTIADMAAIKSQLKAYLLTKNRTDVKVWNYIDNVSDLKNMSGFTNADIERVMDVAATWQHCFGGAEGSCPSAKNKILADRALIDSAGLSGKVELVYLFQTFAMSGGYAMPTLADMQTWPYQFIATNALDGFMYYTWGAWYSSDLINYPDYWPEMNKIYNYSVNSASNPTSSPTKTPTHTLTPTPGAITGDANGDKVVNEQDYEVWKSHFGVSTFGGVTSGDFNTNGKVDGVDYALWVVNAGK